MFSLALVVFTLTGAATASAVSSHQAAPSGSARPVVGSLSTDQTTNPLGIDDSKPQLGWVITSAGRGVSQSTYQIRVAGNEGDLVSGKDLRWDSGTVKSSQSFDVPYGGPALASQDRYYWQVRVQDNHGNLSAWSTPAWFETAFLDPGQFQGSWITSPTPSGGAELLLRKDFTLASGQRNPAITRARLYIAGLSYPSMYVNGHSVTSSVLNTDFTTFNKTVNYSTYDVTNLVRAGSDSLAVSLGNGFYAGGADDYPSGGEPWQAAVPTLKLELQVWYADGSSTRVLSDDSWKVSTGPTTANSPAAETYDAQLAKPGWNQAGYNDGSWASASVLAAATTIPSYSAASSSPAADWLWNTPNAATTTASAGTIYLRKDFTVTDPSAIASAILRINGDDGETAFVNGTQVTSSDPTANNGWQTSQIADVKSLLVAGNNVIAVEGLNVSANASGIIAALQLNSTQSGTTATTIVTDGSWLALPGIPASPPDGWNTASFDDSAWPAANVLGAYGTAPWGTGVASPVTAPAGVLRASLIPPVEETSTIKPVKVTSQAGVTEAVPSYSGTPTADWLWNTPGAASSTASAGTIYLRKDFTVTDPSAIASAILRINGDDGETAFVNGTQVATSGTASDDWETSEVANVASLLVAGNNAIAVEGLNPSQTASGVIAALQLNSTASGTAPTTIVTDGSWLALAGVPASPPDGWNTAGFDDSSWPAANVLGAYGIAPWDTSIVTPTGPSKTYTFPITTSGWAKITMKGTAILKKEPMIGGSA